MKSVMLVLIIIISSLFIGLDTVFAIACDPPQSGDFTLTQSCTFDSNSEGIHGIRNGNLIVPAGVTLTLNANQTIYWPLGFSVQLQGGSIAMNNTAQMKQGDLDEEYLRTLGFDTYAAALPVRIFANNLHVCLSDPCTVSSPAGNGNLIVEGKVKIAGGTPGSGKVLTSDANGEASWQTAAGGIPSGLIAAFAATCPTGWTEYTAARGRYLVGVPLSGTLSATVGTALTDAENRAVGQHLHSVDPGITTSSSEGSHTHSIDPVATATTSQGDHRHTIGIGGEGGGGGTAVFVPGGGNPTSNGVQLTGAHTHSLDIASFTSGAGSSHSHTTDIAAFNSANSGSVVGTNAPYIQVRWCVKD